MNDSNHHHFYFCAHHLIQWVSKIWRPKSRPLVKCRWPIQSESAMLLRIDWAATAGPTSGSRERKIALNIEAKRKTCNFDFIWSMFFSLFERLAPPSPSVRLANERANFTFVVFTDGGISFLSLSNRWLNAVHRLHQRTCTRSMRQTDNESKNILGRDKNERTHRCTNTIGNQCKRTEGNERERTRQNPAATRSHEQNQTMNFKVCMSWTRTGVYITRSEWINVEMGGKRRRNERNDEMNEWKKKKVNCERNTRIHTGEAQDENRL